MRRTVRYWSTVCALAVCCIFRLRANAIEDLSIEEDIAGLEAQRKQVSLPDTEATRRWAILPQIGYAPDTGPVIGAKFTHRNVLNQGVTLDAGGVYAAFSNKFDLNFVVEQPHLLNDQLLIDVRGTFASDPQRYFFGLGNNEQGPDPASTNSFQNIAGAVTVGWRPKRTIALNFSIGVRKVNIGEGHGLGHCGGIVPCPFTVEEFPDLTGVHGGLVNPFSLSLVYDNRDSVVRPTHGWRAILKVAHTNKYLLSDFQFTRIVADLSYVYSFGEGKYVLGIRGDGEGMAGPSNEIPYWELAELGGEDTMRGFFPYRFFGKGRVLLNAEFRFYLFAFNFFKLWRVRFDGAVFGDGGRVFLSQKDATNEFNFDTQLVGPIVSDFRYSYGAGLRIALSEALVARIDAGFSEEEKGLIYLSFGQTF